MSEPEPLSPELCLVSPDLAAAARAALPDRPWERFAPPRPRIEAVPPRTLQQTVAKSATDPDRLLEPARPRRRIVTGGRLATALAAVFLVVTALLPPRHAPRLVDDPARVPAVRGEARAADR